MPVPRGHGAHCIRHSLRPTSRFAFTWRGFRHGRRCSLPHLPLTPRPPRVSPRLHTTTTRPIIPPSHPPIPIYTGSEPLHIDGVDGIPGPVSTAYAAAMPALLAPGGPAARLRARARQARQSPASASSPSRHVLLAARPSGSERCAGEGAQCWCAGNGATVYYGVGDRWHAHPSSGSVWCTNVSPSSQAPPRPRRTHAWYSPVHAWYSPIHAWYSPMHARPA